MNRLATLATPLVAVGEMLQPHLTFDGYKVTLTLKPIWTLQDLSIINTTSLYSTLCTLSLRLKQVKFEIKIKPNYTADDNIEFEVMLAAFHIETRYKIKEYVV